MRTFILTSHDTRMTKLEVISDISQSQTHARAQEAKKKNSAKLLKLTQDCVYMLQR